jgi:uncharacterized membrane protein
MGENHFAATPVALYAGVLLLAAIAYTILARCLVRLHGRESALGVALGRDTKANVSLLCYVIAIASAPVRSWIALALIVLVAILWLVPDRRIEKVLIEPRP